MSSSHDNCGNESSGGMFDVSRKQDTERQAIAQAIIKLDPATINLIRKGRSPKGNIVDAARIAATIGAKRTSDLIPYCHPIPIDYIKVDVLLKDRSIEVKVNVKSVWKTGVEMESLTGASIAALTIYDMLKPVDASLSIESIKLLEKTGGIKGSHESKVHARGKRKLRAAVLVTSDSRGKREDKSGKIAIERLKENGFDIADYKVIPDDIKSIESELRRFCDNLKVDMVVTSGGTGLGFRDVTPEATRNVIDRETNGISEALRAFGQRRTPLSMLSRGVAGIRKNTIIINLPGSSRAVSESLDSLFPGIVHAYGVIDDSRHR